VFGTITTEMILAVLPEIALLVLVATVFIVDLILVEKQRGGLAWLTAAGLAVIFVITLLFSQPGAQGEQMWGGMLRHD